MSDFTGKWNWFIAYDCASYSGGTDVITLNSDGTFLYNGMSVQGSWQVSNDRFTLVATGAPQSYAGYAVGGAMTGTILDRNGNPKGCWYALKQAAGGAQASAASDLFGGQ